MRNCPFRSMAGGAWKSTCLTRTRAWQSNWTVLVGKTVHTGDLFAARDNWPGSLEVRGVCRLTPNGIQRSLTAFHTTVGPERQGVRRDECSQFRNVRALLTLQSLCSVDAPTLQRMVWP